MLPPHHRSGYRRCSTSGRGMNSAGTKTQTFFMSPLPNPKATLASIPPMPTIQGLYETHVTVSDLATSVAFYRDVVGLELATILPERACAFFWIDDKRLGMLGLWQTGTAPLAMRLHLAFRVSLEDVLASAEALRSRGIPPLGFRGEPREEALVIGWMPAISQYFADPDGHWLEFIHVLDEPADPAFGIQTYSDWLNRKQAR